MLRQTLVPVTGRENFVKRWCAREDLNLHPLRDQILSLACLPFHHSRNPRIPKVLPQYRSDRTPRYQKLLADRKGLANLSRRSICSERCRSKRIVDRFTQPAQRSSVA